MAMFTNTNIYIYTHVRMYIFIYLVMLVVFQVISLEGKANNPANKKNKSSYTIHGFLPVNKTSER
jgi:hypothetical protein